MTTPGASQWPLLPPLRLAAVALLCAGVGFLVNWWASLILWIAAIVFLVWASVKFARVWKARSRKV
jgi:energy-coupling factor transporter transmembrane protein EcfT